MVTRIYIKSPIKFITVLILNFLFKLRANDVYSLTNAETTSADIIVELMQLKAICCMPFCEELLTVFSFEQVSIKAPIICPPKPKCPKNS